MEQRSELIRQMFLTYGVEPTTTRVALYVDLLDESTDTQLADAIRDAMRETPTEYPPGPGTVLRHLRAVMRSRPGDPPSPADTSKRLGSGKPLPLLPLFDGLAKRVEHNYSRVVKRAREIREERKLPATMAAQLWSLGEAEHELNYIDPVRNDALERSLAAHRIEAGKKIGVL